MRPLILTNIAGEKIRLNPLAILAWRAAEIAMPGGRVMLGAIVIVADGPKEVQESETQIDWLFERATEGGLPKPQPPFPPDRPAPKRHA